MSQYPLLRLSDVADVVAGDPAPQDPEAFAPDGPLFIRMQDVGRHHLHPALSDSADRLNPDWVGQSRLRLFLKGSVLIPKSGASVNLNHRAKLGTDAYVVSHLAVLTPDTSIVDPDFLYWWSVRYDPRAQAQVTSLPSLKLSTLKKAQIHRPPLEEQRRIVGILNRAARIERLRTKAAELFREFVPALFIKMFGDPTSNPMGWPMERLGGCCATVRYGTSRKANDRGEGVSVLRMGNVTYGGDLDLTDLKQVDLSDAEMAKHGLQAGEILFNRTNSRELVGKTGLWDGRFPAVAASYFIRVRVDESRVLPSYVWAALNSEAMKSRLFAMARGAIGQANINARELKSIPLPVPGRELQAQFVRILRRAATIQQVDQQAASEAASLSASLLDGLLDGAE